ncbi:hypothetical protein JW979_12465, partial [bacterium]|nr:hypothetical protein [candidate division CSSED10-310 bacterium]
ATKLYLLFDSDLAGLAAARKALEISLAAGLDSVAVPLPENTDPDDLVRDQGADALNKRINQGLPALDFLIRYSSQRYNLNLVKGRRDAVEEMLPFLVTVENALDRGIYISRIADLVGVPDQSIVELLKRYGKKYLRVVKPQTASKKSIFLDPRERDFLVLLIRNPHLIEQASIVVPPGKMITQEGNAIYSEILEFAEKHSSKKFDVSILIDHLDQEEERQTIAELAMDPQIDQRLKGIPEENLHMLSIDMKKHHLKLALESNRKKLRDLERAGKDTTECLNEQLRLVKKLRELFPA